MMDLEENAGNDDSNADEQWTVSLLARNKAPNFTHRSMRGLQQALKEGWLVQRVRQAGYSVLYSSQSIQQARDMASFSHDRYRQAALQVARQMPDGGEVRMAFKAITL